MQVMTVVKQLVKSGITICATIHSPTPYGMPTAPRAVKGGQYCEAPSNICRPVIAAVMRGSLRMPLL